MPDFLNQIQIKGSTYSIYDSRLTENNGAIVAAETVYIGTKADANALTTASQVASAISSAMSSIATDRITSGTYSAAVTSAGTFSTNAQRIEATGVDDLELTFGGGGQYVNIDSASGGITLSATTFTFNGESVATEPFVSSAIASALTDTMTYRQAVTSNKSPINAVKGDVFAAASQIEIEDDEEE